MNKNKRNKKLFLMLILVLAVSIGYAAIATTLKINGTTTVKGARWNVYWENPQVTSGSVTTTEPQLSENDTIATYDITLNEPGDFYEFTIDAVNAGSINAKIAENGIKNTVYENDGTTVKTLPAYIGYTVTYADNDEVITEGDILEKANGSTPTKKKYKVKVWYKTDIDQSILNTSTDETMQLKFEVQYVQADKNGVAVQTGAKLIKSKAKTTTDTTEAVAISHEATSQTGALKDYRYMGANPNNYIYFNCDNYSNQDSTTCETWRVIGVTDDERVKIIRQDPVDNTAWDDDNGSYENDWENSTLNATLNGEYLNGNLAYRNIPSKVTTNKNKTTITTTRTNYMDGERSTYRRYGIKNSTTKELIQPSTWYLGYLVGLTPSEAYTNERGNQGGYRNNEPNGASTHIDNTYVGLMYPSDYGYASSGCYNNSTNLSSYRDSTCTDSNWLYQTNGGKYEWLLSPRSDHSDIAFVVHYDGNVFSSNVSNADGVRPTVYLKSNIVFEGTGTSSDPYKIKK